MKNIPDIITDQFIIQYFYNETTHKIIKSSFVNIPNTIIEYLNNRYIDSSCIKETIYRIINHIEKHPLCPVCGKPLKFYGHTMDRIYFNTCNDNVCKQIVRQEKYKQTCLEKYGTTNIFSSEYGKEKLKETWLEKYGTTNPQGNEEIRKKSILTMRQKYGEDINNPFQLTHSKEKIRQTKFEKYGNETYANPEKTKHTCMEKYGVSNPSYVNEINNKKRKTFFKNFNTKEKINELTLRREKTCMEKFGVKNPFLTDECKKLSHDKKSQYKRYLTKKKNHTFNSSKVEQQFKEYLEQNFPNDFEYQYRSELYPFNCDFYIKSLDLYIEIQGTWTHGGHPFDENNQEDIDKLNLWKGKDTDYYNSAIQVWTIGDVKKRNIAKENKLNYLEIFSRDLNKCICVFNEFNNKII